MVVNKATDHFKHKAEKAKVIRAAEIEAAKDVDRENFREWVSIINDLPDSVWYLVIIVFTASFGSKVSDKLMNRKKK
jgi:hypothetical protein